VHRSWPIRLALGVLVPLVLGVMLGRPHGRAAASPPVPPPRATGFAFAPGVQPLDRRAVLDAVASARPEARRLVARVAGWTTIAVGPVSRGAVGLTQGGRGNYLVTLDLGRVSRQNGVRGIRRLVLHELGHVVESALVPPALAASLDAGIPAGYTCDPGVADGACAARQERFAETFAKWATGDLGVDIYLGYKVPPPASLEDWGRPLAALAG
jgi:hypothetical protein